MSRVIKANDKVLSEPKIQKVRESDPDIKYEIWISELRISELTKDLRIKELEKEILILSSENEKMGEDIDHIFNEKEKLKEENFFLVNENKRLCELISDLQNNQNVSSTSKKEEIVSSSLEDTKTFLDAELLRNKPKTPVIPKYHFSGSFFINNEKEGTVEKEEVVIKNDEMTIEETELFCKMGINCIDDDCVLEHSCEVDSGDEIIEYSDNDLCLDIEKINHHMKTKKKCKNNIKCWKKGCFFVHVDENGKELSNQEMDNLRKQSKKPAVTEKSIIPNGNNSTNSGITKICFSGIKCWKKGCPHSHFDGDKNLIPVAEMDEIRLRNYRKNIICKDFTNGNCKRGEECHFKHIIAYDL